MVAETDGIGSPVQLAPDAVAVVVDVLRVVACEVEFLAETLVHHYFVHRILDFDIVELGRLVVGKLVVEVDDKLGELDHLVVALFANDPVGTYGDDVLEIKLQTTVKLLAYLDLTLVQLKPLLIDRITNLVGLWLESALLLKMSLNLGLVSLDPFLVYLFWVGPGKVVGIVVQFWSVLTIIFSPLILLLWGGLLLLLKVLGLLLLIMVLRSMACSRLTR